MRGSIKMFADLFCRGWNSIRVRFWSIGYKKRLLLQLLIVLFIALGGFLLWTSLFTNLADLNFIQKEDGNGSTIWDKWVQENGLKSIGDIWDGCGELFNIFDLLEKARTTRTHVTNNIKFLFGKEERKRTVTRENMSVR